MDAIIVKGARVHNLRNVDATIPRNRLTVVTGLSGSGKSSLAFDTIFAEGQRRYVESLSAYARQFIAQMEKPDVDSIEGLSPAISIDQKTATRNPRSTVGTVTEIYDYMRLLWAKAGQVHCGVCGAELRKQSASEITETIAQMPEGTKIALLAPLIERRKGEHLRLIDAVRREGFVRLRIDGTIVTVDEDIRLDPKKTHTIEIVVDRLIIRDLAPPATGSNPNRTRLADSVELCLKKGEGALIVLDTDTLEDRRFAESFVCPDHPAATIPPMEPRAFSFNSPHGACGTCHGIGAILQVDESAIVPNPALSISEGAIHPWATSASRMTYMAQLLEALSKRIGFDCTTPWRDLAPDHRRVILRGYDAPLDVQLVPASIGKPYRMTYEGVIPNLERRHRETESSYIKSQIEDYMLSLPCPDCGGKRLKKEILAVTVGGKNIVEATDLSIDDARGFFEALIPACPHPRPLPPAGERGVPFLPRTGERGTGIGGHGGGGGRGVGALSDYHYAIAKKILAEIAARLSFLHNVGLSYLTISRSASTLSGGEAQRIRLATQIGSALQGVLYVLDEPSIGLHQKDNARLIATMKHLRDIGNTVLVVEHDEETMHAADYLLEIGPGAGKYGGAVIAQGTAAELMRNPASVTGQYLSGKKALEIPRSRRPGNGRWLTIEDAHHHNLRHLTLRLPLGAFIGVAGVSGSGKSSLIHGILAPALLRALNNAHAKPQDSGAITGLEHLDKTIVIDQSPIGRTPRSNPITYSGIFTDIRDLFALSHESRLRGYKSGRFSFNVKGGRCEDCEGDGMKRIEMHFLPDVYVTCEVCRGRRYNRETLEVTYKGKNIADVLAMTVTEAMEFFTHVPVVRKKLQTLDDVGLGYLHLGQSATTLSGGEAQRVKLATELLKRATGRTFYILDEPTTGLHFDDIRRLLSVLQRLVDLGNTVLVIEHNMDVLKSVDHILDLGPDGGAGGGRIVAQGTPEEVTKVKESYTGQYLKKVLGKSSRT